MKTKTLLLASALGILGTLPALAAWDNIGSVDVGYRHDRDSKNLDFGGPIEGIQLRAVRSDIDCRSVRAVFANGNSTQLFKGRLHQGAERNIDLPGRERNVRRVVFNCGARDHSGGTIRIAADIGNHRAEWQRNPSFASTWAHLFNWTVADNRHPTYGRDRWELVGTERFEGRRDRETSVTGWKGRRVQTVALKPVDANARCRDITANFANGQSRKLDLPRGNFLAQGQFQQMDLPGDVRDLNSLSMRCRATDARRVSIQVFTGR